MSDRLNPPRGDSYPAIAAWFAGGAAVTAVFSGSLATLTKSVGLPEVLAAGMIVPSFTWLVHLGASAAALPAEQRRLYWGDLDRVCLIGSVALLPAAAVNLLVPRAPLWLSVANVVVSVALMAFVLFRRSARHGIGTLWPIAWCLTIAANMAIFTWWSWNWW